MYNSFPAEPLPLLYVCISLVSSSAHIFLIISSLLPFNADSFWLLHQCLLSVISCLLHVDDSHLLFCLSLTAQLSQSSSFLHFFLSIHCFIPALSDSVVYP